MIFLRLKQRHYSCYRSYSLKWETGPESVIFNAYFLDANIVEKEVLVYCNDLELYVLKVCLL